jgi:hypothetical protein
VTNVELVAAKATIVAVSFAVIAACSLPAAIAPVAATATTLVVAVTALADATTTTATLAVATANNNTDASWLGLNQVRELFATVFIIR